MALIKGQIFGDVKGKVAGTVFTRTKSGKMLRARVKPTDAKSAAQVNTRATFSSVTSVWNSLSSLLKRQWNSFAATSFRSKNHKKGNVPSGFQAFASSNFAISLANSHSSAISFSETGVNGTFENFADVVSVAPVKRFSSLCTNTAGDLIKLILGTCELNISAGTLSCSLRTNGASFGAGFSFKNSSSDDPFSLAFYASKNDIPDAVGQVGKGVYYLGNTGLISSIDGVDAMDNFGIVCSYLGGLLASFKGVFIPGSTCYLHAYAVSKDGQFAKIGVAPLTIQ